MHLNEGIEWAVHSCSILCSLPKDAALSARHLAELFDLPAPYLAKTLQQLSAAGLLRTKRGRAGGYMLAKPPEKVTLLSIVEALEGRQTLFRCTEIRRRGPCAAARSAYSKPCGIARAMWRADAAWREALAEITLAEIAQTGFEETPSEQIEKSAKWLGERLK